MKHEGCDACNEPLGICDLHGCAGTKPSGFRYGVACTMGDDHGRVKWFDIAPEDASDIDCTQRPDLEPPVNENGEVCPWPWEPQQLVGYPIGQYHCPYCGAMVMAGMRHLDYGAIDDGPHE